MTTMNEAEAYAHVDAFNSTLKKLARFTIAQSTKLKIADLFCGIDKRISLAINESPLVPLELVGPKLIKYADQIKARNIDFFLAADFKDDIDGDTDADTQGEVVKMIEAVKKIYIKAMPADRDHIADHVDDLLINYCGYMRFAHVEDGATEADDP